MAGFVSFVSAGPGDPELLTLKAVDRLGRADVVLYDALASGPVLGHARPGAELIGVGKRAGRPSAKQDQVNALLVHHALQGQRVVRLKSGDAGIFGRLEEELLAVTAAGIAHEIVPGVTSASAAAAAAGIPLTRRGAGRRLQFVTGADVTGGLPADLNWPALADPNALTIVFMGQATFAAFSEGLIARGLPADTPALLAKAVGHAEQAFTRSTVAELGQALATLTPDLPALIFYGPLAPVA